MTTERSASCASQQASCLHEKLLLCNTGWVLAQVWQPDYGAVRQGSTQAGGQPALASSSRSHEYESHSSRSLGTPSSSCAFAECWLFRPS